MGGWVGWREGHRDCFLVALQARGAVSKIRFLVVNVDRLLLLHSSIYEVQLMEDILVGLIEKIECCTPTVKDECESLNQRSRLDEK